MPDEVSLCFLQKVIADMVALKYSDLAGLEHSIDVAYSIASQRLLETFFDKFNLLDHLRALKSYLMLGAGDFTEHLMEALAYVHSIRLTLMELMRLGQDYPNPQQVYTDITSHPI
jgi:hypothetical protein